MEKELDGIGSEVQFRTSRSSGAGGQHVNKVETKVTLLWDIVRSQVLTDDQKAVLRPKLAARTNADGFVQLEVSETRSQLRNKELALDKLCNLIRQGLVPTKKRIPTKIPRAVALERLDRKKRQSRKKADRRWRPE